MRFQARGAAVVAVAAVLLTAASTVAATAAEDAGVRQTQSLAAVPVPHSP